MKSTSKALGSQLHSLRELKGYGLRELAKKARISPAFLSKVERGEVTPPAEKKLRSLAKVLDADADVLMAMAGRLPADVLKIIQKHPLQHIALLRDLRDLDAEQLAQMRHGFPTRVVTIPITEKALRLFMDFAGDDIEKYTYAFKIVPETAPVVHHVELVINGSSYGLVPTIGDRLGSFVISKAEQYGIESFLVYVDGVLKERADWGYSLENAAKVEIVVKDSRGSQGSDASAE